MVYPETKTKNIVIRAWNYLVGQSSKDDSLYIPDHDSMQEKAMEVYLDTYRSSLVGCELSHHLNVVQIAREVTHIVGQLYIQRISGGKDDKWIASKLPLVSVLCFTFCCNSYSTYD